MSWARKAPQSSYARPAQDGHALLRSFRAPRRRAASRQTPRAEAHPWAVYRAPLRHAPGADAGLRSERALGCPLRRGADSLYESEEGNLRRPAPRQPARHAQGQATGAAGEAEPAPEPVDRTWLEAHLARLARRLQDPLTQSDPRQSLAGLNQRLDAFEQRFSAALGRVAQRSDLENLKSIETGVMELAAQLDRARDRLELIGDVDEEVRGLARKLDAAGEQRAGALEKLLRDCMAEWRESEQRTASALHSLEEAVSRLGDTVDAMEASKPAPELAVPPFAAAGLDRSRSRDGLALPAANGQRPIAHNLFLSRDARCRGLRAEAGGAKAADARGACRARAAVGAAGGRCRMVGAPAPRPTSAAPRRPHRRQRPGMSWPCGRTLRRASVGFEATSPDLPLPPAEASPPDTFKRASLNLLLMAGAAVLAGTTYLLSRTAAAPLPAGSSMRRARRPPRRPTGAGRPRQPAPAPRGRELRSSEPPESSG